MLVAADATGVLIQEAVDDARLEVIVGMSRDPQFGPVVAFGLGGIFVETLKDVQLLLPPLSDAEVRQALRRLRGYPILQGTRGAGPADKARRARHPLFHAAGSSPSLGNSRNHVGAGSAVRLACATAA